MSISHPRMTGKWVSLCGIFRYQLMESPNISHMRILNIKRFVTALASQ